MVKGMPCKAPEAEREDAMGCLDFDRGDAVGVLHIKSRVEASLNGHREVLSEILAYEGRISG